MHRTLIAPTTSAADMPIAHKFVCVCVFFLPKFRKRIGTLNFFLFPASMGEEGGVGEGGGGVGGAITYLCIACYKNT